MQDKIYILIAAGAIMFAVIGGLSLLAHYYTLNGIKSRTVGDGQHGTARFATKKEIERTYKRIPFRPKMWRKEKEQPKEQGIILGSVGKKNEVTALVDTDDVHTLMIGASGVGKTAFFLYPNLEYACATGMSFLCTDTKGDLFRNYGAVARDYYGYNISVIDLRNPTRSDGNNLLHLVNKYMDEYRADEHNLATKAKAEKYAKIISKTIINSSGDSANYGQNAFFYDAAEGLLTSVILLLAEFLPPDDEHPEERRHIISVFKMVQELLEPSNVRGKSQFQLLMAKLPPDHKAKWFAGAALNSSDQAMASVMSTVLSRLNAFLDSEMEQILCFDTAIDAEKFCNTKSAIFIVLPEEDLTKYFMVSLMIQQLYREILSVADEHGGKLPNRVVFYCDELGTIPPTLPVVMGKIPCTQLMEEDILCVKDILPRFGELASCKTGDEIRAFVDNLSARFEQHPEYREAGYRRLLWELEDEIIGAYAEVFFRVADRSWRAGYQMSLLAALEESIVYAYPPDFIFYENSTFQVVTPENLVKEMDLTSLRKKLDLLRAALSCWDITACSGYLENLLCQLSKAILDALLASPEWEESSAATKLRANYLKILLTAGLRGLTETVEEVEDAPPEDNFMNAQMALNKLCTETDAEYLKNDVEDFHIFAAACPDVGSLSMQAVLSLTVAVLAMEAPDDLPETLQCLIRFFLTASAWPMSFTYNDTVFRWILSGGDAA